MSETDAKDVGLLRDQRGAVLAEFVVAFIPLVTVFFVFLQISAMAAAKIRFKHSAVVGARAAAVFSKGNGTCPECTGEGDGTSDVTQAVRAALGTGIRNYDGVNASMQDRSGPTDPYGLITVTVTGNYKCGVPLGKVICGTDGQVTFTEKKSMPHQGALYKLQ